MKSAAGLRQGSAGILFSLLQQAAQDGGAEGDRMSPAQPLENKDFFYSDCCRCGIPL